MDVYVDNNGRFSIGAVNDNTGETVSITYYYPWTSTSYFTFRSSSLANNYVNVYSYSYGSYGYGLSPNYGPTWETANRNVTRYSVGAIGSVEQVLVKSKTSVSVFMNVYSIEEYGFRLMIDANIDGDDYSLFRTVSGVSDLRKQFKPGIYTFSLVTPDWTTPILSEADVTYNVGVGVPAELVFDSWGWLYDNPWDPNNDARYASPGPNDDSGWAGYWYSGAGSATYGLTISL